MPELPAVAEVRAFRISRSPNGTRWSRPPPAPVEARTRVSRILNEVKSTSDYTDFNGRFGLEYELLTPRETQAFMDDELNRASVIAKKAGIKFEQ